MCTKQTNNTQSATLNPFTLSRQPLFLSMTQRGLAAFVLLSLVACGGGGGSSNEVNEAVDTTVTGGSVPAALPRVTSTAELVVPEDFEFSIDALLTIEFTLPANKDTLYLSLCQAQTEFAEATPAIADYQNCVLRTWVKRSVFTNGEFEQSVQLMAHIKQLVAVVFDPETMTEKSVYWRRAEGMQFTVQ